MRKIYSLLLLGGLLFFGVQNALADDYLVGNWKGGNDWVTGDAVKFDFPAANGIGYLTIYLNASTTYYFKFLNGSTYYGNSGEMTSSNNTNWLFTNNNGESATARITTSIAGNYVFKVDWSSGPKISVLYPSNAVHSYTIKFDNSETEWTNVYAYVDCDVWSDWLHVKPLGNWQGVQVTTATDGIYSHTFNSTYLANDIIWHNGSGTETPRRPFGNCTYKSTDGTDCTIESYSVKTNANGWASFCAYEQNVTIPAGVTIYVAVYSSNNNTLTLYPTANTSGKVIAHSVGVILKGEANTTYTLNSTTSDAETLNNSANNSLRGFYWAGTPATGKVAYVLGTQDSNTGFYQYSGYKVPAFKAALELDAPSSGDAPSVIRMEEEENNTTSIETIETNDKAVKFFENGQLRILREGVVYDATGRVVR